MASSTGWACRQTVWVRLSDRLEVIVAYNDDVFTASDVHYLMDAVYGRTERLLSDAGAQTRLKEGRHV